MAREALFDLAVNRALTYAARLGLLPCGEEHEGPNRTRPGDRSAAGETLRIGLEPWYLKTRFAYRVPLEQVVTALEALPPGADARRARWDGGPDGHWVVGPG